MVCAVFALREGNDRDVISTSNVEERIKAQALRGTQWLNAHC
jgi:hypothetical protein